jgi:hypothetical protein
MKALNFDKLIDCMNIRKPVLVLGAGFSIGAQNANGNLIPSGRELSNRLYEEFYVKGDLVRKTNTETLKEISNQKDDLKSICTFLRIQEKAIERNNFLTEQFAGCRLVDDSPQYKLVHYPWPYIFTLNIDDLIEKIYQQAGLNLSIWDLSHPSGNSSIECTRLIKLHGSVNDSDSGYVFDDEEYRNFTIESNSLLKEFAHQALQSDLVFVGTEFQEEDLQWILDLYKKCGYNDGEFKRFFITPKIRNTRLRLQIESSPNDIWIEADTSTFLNTIFQRITAPNDIRDRLRERGVIFLDEINRQKPSTLDLYKGAETTYADFFHDADILRSSLDDWKREILSGETRQIISFYGESYVGKSCCARRLLTELFYQGYYTCQINHFSESISDLLIEYCATLPNGSNAAMFLENAAFEYKQLIELKKMCPSKINKLVIITEDTTENHRGKRYLLQSESGFYEREIIPEMNDSYATLIFDKLARKKRLGYYLNLLPAKSNPFSRHAQETIRRQIKKENDIIDALYFSSEGKSFQKHYQRWLHTHSTDPEQKLLQGLCCLSTLGITWLPNPLLASLGQTLLADFKVNDFCHKYSEVISSAYGKTRLRRDRVLSQLLPTIDIDLVLHVLGETAIYTKPYYEYSKDESVALFQKALRVKRIRNCKLLPPQKILSLLASLEKHCDHLSYFWIQYGIAAQVNKQYGDANNHLLYAQNLQPRSYQVCHALAKNDMEWGLSLSLEHIDEGKEKFNDGSSSLLKLVYNRNFSDSFRYSVHTFVNMWLNYADKTGEIITNDCCSQISKMLEEILNRPLDNMLSALIKRFIEYCQRMGLSDYCRNLYSVYKTHERYRVDEEEYDRD